MTTHVLVHGAWYGAWCWQKVRTTLEAGGAEVHTPTLTGLGDRAPPQLKTLFEEQTRVAGRFLQEARSFINCIGDKPFGQSRSTQAEGIED